MKTKTLNTILVCFIILFSIIVAYTGFFSNESMDEGKKFETVNGEIVTLYGKGLYHKESVSMASQARAQDIVTLVFAIPLLILSLILTNKNSIKGKLLLTGTLGYFLYTYVTYSFLTMYNQFFLIYVLIMSLSLFAFLINICSLSSKGLKDHFNQKFPKKYIGIFNIFMGVCVCLLWLGMIIASIGGVPSVLEHYTTLVIQAMDLGIVVPVAILSGILLIKDNSLGYLFAPIIIIKGVTLVLAIVMMIIFMAYSGVNISIVEAIMFPLFAIVLMVNLYLVLKNLEEEKNTNRIIK